MGFVTPASATQNAGRRAGVFFCWRGNAAGAGGFDFYTSMGMSSATTQSAQQAFAGLCGTTSIISANINPSAFINAIGLAKEPGLNNMQIIHNDGSGGATLIDLGANFPANTVNTDMYELRLLAEPNGSGISYRVTRLNTGDEATGNITTNLPSDTTMLSEQSWTSNGAGTAACGIDVPHVYVNLKIRTLN